MDWKLTKRVACNTWHTHVQHKGNVWQTTFPKGDHTSHVLILNLRDPCLPSTKRLMPHVLSEAADDVS